VRDLSVERREREAVGRREVAHDALQVAARREVEDDVQRPRHPKDYVTRDSARRRPTKIAKASASRPRACRSSSAAPRTARRRSAPPGPQTTRPSNRERSASSTPPPPRYTASSTNTARASASASASLAPPSSNEGCGSLGSGSPVSGSK